jgi:CubicO group peptidase (beta-lactamase class C family)
MAEQCIKSIDEPTVSPLKRTVSVAACVFMGALAAGVPAVTTGASEAMGVSQGRAGSRLGGLPLPPSAPQDVGLKPAQLSEATELLKRFVAEQKLAGAVAAVARRGRLAYIEAAGLQDIAARRPMAIDSMFRIYSMTKPITAVAVMMLYEEGRFRLDDPVSKYLAEFKEVSVAAGPGNAPRRPSREITIEDLLLHTSGLNHRTSEPYRAAHVRSRSDSLPRFIANIVRVPLMEDPGTLYRYSESPTVLGRLVEIWSGKPFDVFLNERVFKPLGMTDTVFFVAPEDRSRLATVYAIAQGGGLTATEIEAVPFTERAALVEGAVGLVSTVPDFIRFSQMLLNKGELNGSRILQTKTIERMTTNGLSDPVLKRRGGGMGWGLGNVNVVMDADSLNYPASKGEYGWDGSAGTIFWVDPALEMVTVLMWQSVPANPDSLRQRFKTLVHAAAAQ